MWILRSTPNDDAPKLRTFRISSHGPRTIGRSTVADFRVDVPMISRVHCRLTATPEGALEVEDLSSTNGTFVNDERVERSPLSPGDRVRVGRLEMFVEHEEIVPPQPVPGSVSGSS
jgi:pSer/pThr/pTyr-binding forkhead associated (FHA) protein